MTAWKAARAWLALPEEERGFSALAWAVAPLVSGSLALAGFRRTMRWVEALPRATRGRTSLEPREAEALVRRALRHQLASRGCLPRSITQFVAHRLTGGAVVLRVGVRRGAHAAPEEGLPLDAHAWVARADDAPSETDGAYALLYELRAR